MARDEKGFAHHVDARPFAKLFNNPTDFNVVLSSLEHTIMASFAIDAAMQGRTPQITNEKIRTRFKVCEKWFRVMRGDLGYGLKRTLDSIPKALACELIGQPFVPDETTGRGFSRMDFDKEAARLKG